MKKKMMTNQNLNEESILKHYAWLNHKQQTELLFLTQEDKVKANLFITNSDDLLKYCKKYSGLHTWIGVNERKLNGTKSEDIEFINNFIIDVDSKDKDNIDVEKNQLVAEQIIKEAKKQGYQEPLFIFSGRGYHIYFALEPIENTEENREKIKTFGQKIKEKYETDSVEIDEKCFDPARKMRLAGTINIKPDCNKLSFVANPKNTRVNDTKLTQDILNITLDKPLQSKNVELEQELRNLIEKIIPFWVEGKRNDFCMCLAGYLRKEKKLGFKKVKEIITEICNRTNDNEIDSRKRTCTETFMKDESEIKGYQGLVALGFNPSESIGSIKDVVLKQEEEKTELKIYDWNDIKNFKPKPQEWLITNLIPKHEVGIIGGKRKEKKTFISLCMALCLASGTKCFDEEVPEKKKVLILDAENGFNEIAKRLKFLSNGLGLENANNLDIKIIDEPFKLDGRHFSKYEEIIRNFKPDLIIVDCLQRFVSIDLDKDNQGISEFFTTRIKPLTRELGCSWLFVHHFRKGMPNTRIIDELDELRGASELGNYSRYVLICSVPRDTNYIRLSIPKMSNQPQIEPKALIFDTTEQDKIKIIYEGLAENIITSEMRTAKAIKDWILQNNITKEFKTADVIEALEKDYKKTSISSGLRCLTSDDFLTKISRGVYQVKA